MELRKVTKEELDIAVSILEMAKKHLKEQGIDQWQDGYPDRARVLKDIEEGKGYFAVNADMVWGYLYISFDGEPSYRTIDGAWEGDELYVVVHRIAFSDDARGKGGSGRVFRLVEEMSAKRGVHYFRIDTHADNKKMQHVLTKYGFTFRGTVRIDCGTRLAFEKKIIL